MSVVGCICVKGEAGEELGQQEYPLKRRRYGKSLLKKNGKWEGCNTDSYHMLCEVTRKVDGKIQCFENRT